MRNLTLKAVFQREIDDKGGKESSDTMKDGKIRYLFFQCLRKYFVPVFHLPYDFDFQSGQNVTTRNDCLEQTV